MKLKKERNNEKQAFLAMSYLKRTLTTAILICLHHDYLDLFYDIF